MSAMPPAAAPTDRYSLTSAKKRGVADAIPMTAKDRARIDPTTLDARAGYRQLVLSNSPSRRWEMNRVLDA